MDEEHDAHAEHARQVIRSLVPAWQTQPLDAMHWLTGGYTNRNWRFAVDGRNYAVRVVRNLGPRPAEATYLALPSAPAVVAFDEARGHLITEWIDAPTLAQAPASAEETGMGIARLHGEIPAGIQRYDVPAVIAAYFRAAKDAGCLDARAATALQRLAWQPSRIKGCHNDLNPWNVLSTPGGWRTLDWEHAGDNDPLFDVLGLCTCLEWDQDATWTCVHAWSEAIGAPPPSSRHFHGTLTAFYIREYAWAAAQLAQGNDRPEIREQATDYLSRM
ncbi:MAG: phosphotransferase [Gammaproteobacteria bacterium]|nr:phosphotransferase [Gammaproteobacteria bacterium]